jgi:L-fucose isomerase-like protein
MERFTYTVVASPLHDADTIAALTAPLRSQLDELGGRPDAGTADDHRRPAHLFLVATGGTERSILETVPLRRWADVDEPVVLAAHRAHNSLPAALEALAALQQAGRTGRIVHQSGDAARDRAALAETVTDMEAFARLRATRLGVIGGPSEWLVASSPSADVVRRRWGPTVDVIDPRRMVELSRRASQSRADVAAAPFLARAHDAGDTPRPDEVVAAAAVGVALDDVVAETAVDAVSVRCFDLLTEPGTSGCLALAALNDRGVVAGCEGDLASTLGMLWVHLLLGQPSWMANPAHVDERENQVVLAHCTVAPSLVDGLSLSTHFESGIGVGIRGHFERQPVPVLRIGGRELDRHWIAEGRIVATTDDASLCRTQATVELTDRTVGDLLAQPLGNHLVVVRGHHRERLERWWSLVFGPDDERHAFARTGPATH